MKKIITLLILTAVSISVQLMSFLPWWSFLAVVFLLGIALPLKKWKVSSFRSGFIAGLLVWSLSTLYFEVIYKAEVMGKISALLHVPPFLLYIIIGVIGGILTGLAFYSGFLLRSGKEELQLELPRNKNI